MPLIDIAAALASLSQGTTPLLLTGKSERPAETHLSAERAPSVRDDRPPRATERERNEPAVSSK